MESPAVEPDDEAAAAGPPRLRRLGRAIIDRDWIAIAIELIVVTVGVLLAFEAQQWGEEVGRHRDEREFLERLYRETGEEANELDGLVQNHQSGIRELGAVLRAKNDPARLSQYAERQDFGCIIGTLPSAGYNDTAFEELVSSGRISTISDPELRDSVRKMAAYQSEGENRLAYYREVVNSMAPAYLPYYRNELRNGDYDVRCTIDWRHLMANPASAAALAKAYRVHQLLFEIRRDTLTATLAVRRQLACSLGKPECRH